MADDSLSSRLRNLNERSDLTVAEKAANLGVPVHIYKYLEKVTSQDGVSDAYGPAGFRLHHDDLESFAGDLDPVERPRAINGHRVMIQDGKLWLSGVYDREGAEMLVERIHLLLGMLGD